MNNFSDFVNDLDVSTKTSQIGSMTESEVNQFLLKTNKIIPKQVQNIIQLTKKYDILHKEELDSIRESSKQNLKKVYNDNFSQNHKNMTYDEMRGFFESIGEKKFRADQVFRKLYQISII